MGFPVSTSLLDWKKKGGKRVLYVLIERAKGKGARCSTSLMGRVERTGCVSGKGGNDGVLVVCWVLFQWNGEP